MKILFYSTGLAKGFDTVSVFTGDDVSAQCRHQALYGLWNPKVY